jgi:hypothetical protein
MIGVTAHALDADWSGAGMRRTAGVFRRSNAPHPQRTSVSFSQSDGGWPNLHGHGFFFMAPP